MLEPDVSMFRTPPFAAPLVCSDEFQLRQELNVYRRGSFDVSHPVRGAMSVARS